MIDNIDQIMLYDLNSNNKPKSKEINGVIIEYEWIIEKPSYYNETGEYVPAIFGIKEVKKLPKPKETYTPSCKDVYESIKEENTDKIIELLKKLPDNIKEEIKNNI